VGVKLGSLRRLRVVLNPEIGFRPLSIHKLVVSERTHEIFSFRTISCGIGKEIRAPELLTKTNRRLLMLLDYFGAHRLRTVVNPVFFTFSVGLDPQSPTCPLTLSMSCLFGRVLPFRARPTTRRQVGCHRRRCKKSPCMRVEVLTIAGRKRNLPIVIVLLPILLQLALLISYYY